MVSINAALKDEDKRLCAIANRSIDALSHHQSQYREEGSSCIMLSPVAKSREGELCTQPFIATSAEGDRIMNL